ncbi:MAG: hypothetical protein U5J63_11415 [Fodinibius sp.]|nr:hypothetical protein [Fodinibius sp.]
MPYDHQVHFAASHQRARGRISNQLHRDFGVHQLPGGQPRALQQRTRFINPHLNIVTLLMGMENDRQRRSVLPGGQAAGVAVSQDFGAFADEFYAVFANFLADALVLSMDGLGGFEDYFFNLSNLFVFVGLDGRFDAFGSPL